MVYYHMATAEMTTAEIEATMGTIKKMLAVGALFVVVGYALLTVAGIQELVGLSALPGSDSGKMWLKLGGVVHVLVGVFIALTAIVRTLSLVPHRLGAQME